MLKVCKFGGTSLADAAQIRKVAAIVQSDPTRRFVVPSAPGKRNKADQKITDLLYLCHAHAGQRLEIDSVFNIIEDRYLSIVAELGLSAQLDLKPLLDRVREDIRAGASADYCASRGEYLSGPIVAAALGFEFIDAADVVFFDKHGKYDPDTTMNVLGRRLAQAGRAVIPGFYGRKPDGQIKTFSRGGSDITGAIVAAAANASVYENWTDVSGLLMADPRIIKDAKPMDLVTYRELRELAYMGANVFHDEAVFPVRDKGIPVNIRNTNDPSHPGTMIVNPDKAPDHRGGITGVAGKKGFTVITLEKSMMNTERGFGRRVLAVLEAYGVSFEHMPTSIDTLSVVVANSELHDKLDDILSALRQETKPDGIEVERDMALVAVVGRGMAHTPGMAAKVFGALGEAHINVRMMDQGSSELNIIVGVESADMERAVEAIYRKFEG